MSSLAPWLAVLAVGGGAFLVGKYFQREERKQREVRKQRQREANPTASTLAGFADLWSSMLTIRSTTREHPLWTQEKALEKTQGRKQELGSIQGQQQPEQSRPN